MTAPPHVLVLAATEPNASPVVAALRHAGQDVTVRVCPDLADVSVLSGAGWDLTVDVPGAHRAGIPARIQHLRSLLPGVPVLVVLPDEDAGAALAAIRAGARDALLLSERGRLPELATALAQETARARREPAVMETLQNDLARERQVSARIQAVAAITDAALARGDDASAVYQELAERIAALLGVDAVSVRLLDHNDQLRTQAAYNIPREFWDTITPRPGEPTTGLAVSEQRTVVVRDLFANPPATPALARFRQQVAARSMLSSPIVVNERIIGVINAFARAVRDFTDDEIRLVESAAARVGAVAVQAQLIRATREALAARDHALRAAESERDRLRQMIEVLPEGIVIAAADGSIVHANAASEQALGRTPRRDDATRDSALRARKMDGGPYRPSETPLARALGTGEIVRGEQMTIWNAAEQRDVTLLVNSAPLRDAGQQITGAVAAFHDVTAIKQTEAQLLHEKRFSESVIDALPSVFYLFTGEGRFLRWNANFEQVSGYTGAEIASMHPRQFFRGDDVSRVERQIRDVLARGQADGEVDFVAKDGGARPYYFTGLRIEVEDVACVLGVGIDITERRQADEALRRSEERFRSLVQNTSDVIAVLDAEGRVSYISPPIQRMLGYPPQQFTDAAPFALVHDDDRRRLARNTRRIVRTPGFHRPSAYRLRHADGSWRVIEVTANNLLADPVVRGVVEVLRDVTERRQAEAERAELLTRERQARAEAERAAGRTARLQAVTAALSEALTPDDVVRVGLEQAMAAFGADAGAILLLNDAGELVAAGASGYRRGYFREWRRFPATADLPVSRAARTGELVIVESAAERAARFPHLSAPMNRSEYEAIAAVPLGAEGRIFGAMNLSFRGERVFDEEERAVLLAFGRQCALALERARLYESEERARRAADAARARTAFLAEAGEVLGRSLDHETTLRNVARIAIPRFADWSYVYLVDAGGGLRPIGVAHMDAAQEPLMRELSQHYPTESAHQHPIIEAVRTRRPVLLPVVEESHREQFVTDARHLELIRSLAARSALVMPLISGDQVLGTISFGRAVNETPYGAEDLELAEELSRRAAAAIERSRLYSAEQAARAEAETAREHLAMLADASEQLASSLELEPTLRAVARLAIPRFADWCNVYLTDDRGRLRSIEVAHTDPAREALLRELIRSYPPDLDRDDHPIRRAMHTGKAVLLPAITDEWRRGIAQDARHLELMRQLGSASTMVVPLVTREHTLGVLSFGFVDAVRQFGQEQVNLAGELARRAAAAIERARLWEEIVAVSARERSHALRLQRLAACALAVTSALTLASSLRIIADSAREIAGAAMAIITLSADEARRGAATTIARRGPRTNRDLPDIAAGAGAIAAVLNEEKLPPRVTRAELDARLPALTQAIPSARLPQRGVLAVPLTGREGQYLGLIQIWDRLDGDFTDDDEAALVQLAQFASVEIENERLQQQASAAAAAVEADRLKGELLATVSHELRTPLAAIKGFTTAMLAYFDRIDREEQHSFLAEIDGAADRLHELVENLLRLSRLEAGTLDFRRTPANLAPVLERSLADARRRYPDRVITLDIAGELPEISVDVRRITQVLANLIDNAIKYSPDGGEVELRARSRADAGVEISITDQGIGIPPEHLDRVFDRFHRVDNSATREIGGTGLGLAICKRIVEQHGGTIRVESKEGHGSTFTITLPREEA